MWILITHKVVTRVNTGGFPFEGKFRFELVNNGVSQYGSTKHVASLEVDLGIDICLVRHTAI